MAKVTTGISIPENVHRELKRIKNASSHLVACHKFHQALIHDLKKLKGDETKKDVLRMIDKNLDFHGFIVDVEDYLE